ncbi:MAG: DUF4389 domain-containing protein [Candidatus Marinimicrobia bacterium]|jgi:hypothetical protein|nr:DUF4389 domain-containing protein [Candidatus Neomarinimicrobiota bacterium]
MPQNNKYPVTLDIDYSDKSDRLTAFFRLILVIPILIILGLLLDNNVGPEYGEYVNERTYGVGIIFIPTLLMILFRQKYPKWWYNFNVELTKFGTRVGAYIFLLRDEYPSTDEKQSVHINIPYPNVKKDLVNWMPLVKWFLAIPHVIILCFLWIGAIIAVILAWFAILFTGTHPKGIHDYIVGVIRWSLRVEAYAILLTTDKYPPFSLT